MNNTTTNSEAIVAKLNQAVDTLTGKILQIKNKFVDLSNSERLEELEKELQRLTQELGDSIAAIKVQQHIDSDANKTAEKELLKLQPGRMKNMGLVL